MASKDIESVENFIFFIKGRVIMKTLPYDETELRAFFCRHALLTI